MSKQDRQGARTASDLEMKYNFGKTFAEIMGYATDARDTAQEALDTASAANEATKATSSQITVQLDGIRAEVAETYTTKTETKSVSTQMEVMKDEFAVKLTKLSDDTSDANESLQKQLEEITTYFRFTDEGQYIGRSDSEMQTRFANAMWEFLLNGEQQLYINPSGVHGKQIHTDSLYIGNLVFQEQQDGSVIVS